MSDKDVSTPTSSVARIIDQLPDPMSEPCSRYLYGHWEQVTFSFFVPLQIHAYDELHRNAAKTALEKDAVNETARLAMLRMVRDGAGAWGAFRSRERLFIEMVFTRAVDNYLCYVSEILAEIFRSRPETLRTSDQIRVDEALQFSSMADLVARLAEKRVHDLSYKGMRVLTEDLSKRLGFPLFEDETDLTRAIRIIEERNLIVHNRGIVNQLFLTRTSDTSLQVGERINLEDQQVWRNIDFLCGSVCDVDTRIAAKFGLTFDVAREQHEKRFQDFSRTLKKVALGIQPPMEGGRDVDLNTGSDTPARADDPQV